MARRGVVIAYNGADTGLGNRVRVTLAAANLAAAEGRRLWYVWPRTKKFEPALVDLWDWRHGGTVPRIVSRALALVTGYHDHHLRDIRSERGKPIWQIRTGGVLELPDGVAAWQDTLRGLKPSPAIAQIVEETFADGLRGHPYVGVQIRVHSVSHQKTKDASPLTWYMARMDEILRNDPTVRFFISCDVGEVKERLLEEYPTAVGITHDAPYNSTRAVQLAVADLYLLASSSRMLGPHYSSFIEMAQYLSHPSVETEKAQEDPPSPDWSTIPLAQDPLRPWSR